MDVNQKSTINELNVRHIDWEADINGGLIFDIGGKYNVIRELKLKTKDYKKCTNVEETYGSYNFNITGKLCNDDFFYYNEKESYGFGISDLRFIKGKENDLDSNPICVYNKEALETCNGFAGFSRDVGKDYSILDRINSLITTEKDENAFLYTHYEGLFGLGAEIVFGNLKNILNMKEYSQFQLPIETINIEGKEEKWAAQLKAVYFGDIFENRKDMYGNYLVSEANPHYDAKGEEGSQIIFETIYNKIILPDEYRTAFEENFAKKGLECYFKDKQEYGIDFQVIVCPQVEIFEVPPVHFILSNGLDVFFQGIDLFYYGKSEYDYGYVSYIEFSREYSRIIFGLPFFRKFGVYFKNIPEDKSSLMVLHSKSNKATVQIFTPRTKTYLRVDCPVIQDLIECPMELSVRSDKRSFVLDLSARRTWIDQAYYDIAEIKDTVVEWNESHFYVAGNESFTKVKFAGVTVPTFNLLESTNHSSTFKYVIGLGRYIDKDGILLKSVLDYAYIDETEPDNFILQFTDDGATGQSYASLIFGDVDKHLLEKSYYKLPLQLTIDPQNKHRWATNISYIFIGNILNKRTRGGEYNVSLSNPHFAFKEGTLAYLETIHNGIYVPFELFDSVVSFIEKNYLETEGQKHKCVRSIKNHNVSYLYCYDEDNDDLMELPQIHLILSNGVDLFLDSQDLFICNTTNKQTVCEFVIQGHHHIKDNVILGIPILKKYAINFNASEESTTIELYSTGNKAEVTILNNVPEKELYIKLNCRYTDYIYCPLTLGPHENITYDFVVDNSGGRTWIKEEDYNIFDNLTEQFSWTEDLFNQSTDVGNSTVIFGGIKARNFPIGRVEKGKNNAPFDRALGLGRELGGDNYELITVLLEEMPRELSVNTKTWALQFYDEGSLGLRYASFLFGNLNKYLVEKTPYTMYVSLSFPDEYPNRWSTEIYYIYTGQILKHRTYEGEYNITLADPHFTVGSINNKTVNAFFETTSNAIYIPNRFARRFWDFLEKRYFVVDGVKHDCHREENTTHVYYVCNDEDWDAQIELDQIHFILQDDYAKSYLDIYLDSEDLFDCDNTGKVTKCTFLIMEHKNIVDKFIFGLPIIKKFTTVFSSSDFVKEIKLISTGNKARVRIVEKTHPEYISIDCELKNHIYCPLELGEDHFSYNFVLDISAKRTWISEKIYDITEINRTDAEWTEEMYHVKGECANIRAVFGGVDVKDFYPMDSSDFSTPWDAALGLGRFIGGKKNQFGLINRAIESMNIEEPTKNTWVLQFPDEGQFGSSKPQLLFGDLNRFLAERAPYTLRLILSAVQGQEHRWSTEVKYIFASNILVNRTFEGEYNVSLNDNHHFTVGDNPVYPGYLETVYNAIYVPSSKADAIFQYLMDNYFTVEGKKHKCEKSINGDITRIICEDEDNDDLMEMNQIHFITEEDIDLYLDSEDLFFCTPGKVQKCVFAIQSHAKIDHFIFGIPMLKKFATVFNTAGSITSISLISTGNKAEIKFVDGNDDPNKKKGSRFGLFIFVILASVFIVAGAAVAIVYFIVFRKYSQNSTDGILYDQFANEMGGPENNKKEEL